jgi:hypothetical protein
MRTLQTTPSQAGARTTFGACRQAERNACRVADADGWGDCNRPRPEDAAQSPRESQQGPCGAIRPPTPPNREQDSWGGLSGALEGRDNLRGIRSDIFSAAGPCPLAAWKQAASPSRTAMRPRGDLACGIPLRVHRRVSRGALRAVHHHEREALRLPPKVPRQGNFMVERSGHR